MKLLITGSTGFIGTYLCKRLQQKYELVALVRPASNTQQLDKQGIKTILFSGDTEELFQSLSKEKIDGIVHLASLYLKSHQSSDITNLIDSNVLFPTQLLEAATRAKIPWVINTGTFWQHYQNEEYSPVNLYAATKQACIDIAKYYQATSVTKFVTLKLSDTFGPGDTRPKIFTLWQKAVATGIELQMSAGEQILDITYIDNVIDAFEHLIENLQLDVKKVLEEYVISSPEKPTLQELALLFEKVTDKKLPIVWGALPYRDREVMAPWDKGVIVPGWQAKISLEEGIKRTCEELL